MKYDDVDLDGVIGWFINSQLDEYDGHNYTCRNCGAKIGSEDNITTSESYCPHYHKECYYQMYDKFIDIALKKKELLRELIV